MSSSQRSGSAGLSRRAAILGVTSAVALWARGSHAGEASGIHLLPLGSGVRDEELALVRRALAAVFSMPVGVLPKVELPKSAYYAPRSRYRAEKLLDFIRPQLPSGG